MIIDDINIDSLLKAFKKFETFRKNTGTEQEKVGAIQAFEYSFELVWKTIDLFRNSTSADNCCVAPMLESSCTLSIPNNREELGIRLLVSFPRKRESRNAILV